MTKYPTLIYDGPFSDHITETDPKGLKGGTITLDTAKKKAVNAIKQIIGDNLNVSDGQPVKGKVKGFTFNIGKENEPNYSIDISKKGGHVVNFISSRNVKSAQISSKQAAQKAQEYLAVLGYPNMEPTFSETKSNIAYISFAYKPDDIIFYPDIIDVQVARDNGQILAIEALSYLMSHQKRDVVNPEISEDKAKNLVSSEFDKVEDVKLVVIPQDSQKETLCYEIRGTTAEEVYLIYINANSGNEEQILKLVSHSNGTFTI
jgi:germination protein YpeB